MEKDAIFSDDRIFRYVLWRIWDRTKPLVTFIGLNPSTADEEADDQTIKKCVGFVKRWGYGGLYMVNLFAFRATRPRELLKSSDPVGPNNDEWIEKILKKADLVVGAWGNHGSLLGRGQYFVKNIPNFHYLKINKSGHSAHPLYIKYGSKLNKF
jgi:hypothetical protein